MKSFNNKFWEFGLETESKKKPLQEFMEWSNIIKVVFQENGLATV